MIVVAHAMPGAHCSNNDFQIPKHNKVMPWAAEKDQNICNTVVELRTRLHGWYEFVMHRSRCASHSLLYAVAVDQGCTQGR